MKHTHHTTALHDLVDSATGYAVAALGYSVDHIGNIDWMALGAGLLLIVRLVQDVPRALTVLRRWRDGTHEKNSD